jgi:cytidylate kinase
VVCISQTTGSGGPQVGLLVAERLGYRCVDEEIIVMAAEHERVAPAELQGLERRQTLIAWFMETLEHRERIEAFAHAALHPEEGGERPSLASSAELRAAIRAAIQETAEQGHVVIVSHGASIALAEAAPPPLRVFVTASPETRATRIAEQRKVGLQRARGVVQETDRSRADYLRRFYSIRHEQSTHYDLVVNTDLLGYDQAADVIVAAASIEITPTG